MASEDVQPMTRLKVRIVKGELKAHGWTWQGCGAVIGISCGIATSILGSALTAFSWFAGPLWHGYALQRDGTALLFLTIPLLIIGAHCFDLMDGKKRKIDKPHVKSDRD